MFTLLTGMHHTGTGHAATGHAGTGTRYQSGSFVYAAALTLNPD